ncbi:MarR family winged helix-turn-helix transcriptional regulator [Kitasatospora sp. NPDC093550]|uniref:MarR family winged helix-turn-helix transcriptional regulator n=1 Tax=Kitasatospora sp. NPDC093550 TaxID=3364089 RepID=UPI0037F22EDE
MQQESADESRRKAVLMSQECLGRRIARLQRLVGRRVDAELRRYGLTLPQVEVLSELASVGGPARPSDIAGWLGIERSTVSRNLELLVQRGFVEVAATSSTGRTTRVAVTEAGHRALAEAEPAWRRGQAWIGEAIGADARETLDRWIAALDPDHPAR